MAVRTSTDVALAIIPARGGSKRLSRKNIRPFLGVPLLVRTVAMLREAEVFDRIVVTTDDDEIAEIARNAGADAPFRRPAELANDTAATIPVIVHAIRAMDGFGALPALVCCAYPAAVLATPTDVRTALEMIRESDADYVFTTTTFRYPIQRALRQLPDGGCEMFSPEHLQTRSQDLEPAYHDAGFYRGRRAAWLEERPIFSPKSRMLVLPHHRVQDIDTEEDWLRAEMIFERSRNGRSAS